ncbi:hypothetical protein EHS13_03495 [Paenibacillus psychroresistens]|uniref:Uncharacterized protein n=1 Tax=Paenibacillus psychroresistens TaxID=1778678 RepID=A0A6B8RCZ3_9BACL|nr:CBO0543 family protein [Paenibacillus psychroresistens]QGQ94040.1 hypothetical protein EHS13_03495 [Paenibacillus psychroresistens]
MAYPSFDKLEEVRKGYLDLYHEYWLNNVLFSFDWWLLLTISIVPWIIWWKIVDKSKLTQIVLYGFFVSMEAVLLDIFLTNLIKWGYQSTFIYLLQPISSPYDLSFLPVVFMLIYQKFAKWKGYLITCISVSAVLTFILEPLLDWMNIIKKYNISFFYLFLFYTLIAISSKWIVAKIAAGAYEK